MHREKERESSFEKKKTQFSSYYKLFPSVMLAPISIYIHIYSRTKLRERGEKTKTFLIGFWRIRIPAWIQQHNSHLGLWPTTPKGEPGSILNKNKESFSYISSMISTSLSYRNSESTDSRDPQYLMCFHVRLGNCSVPTPCKKLKTSPAWT